MSHLSPRENGRSRRLNIRLNQQEWDKVHNWAAKTTCRSISEYARKLLLNKPVNVFFRNQSFDDLQEQLIRLLPELETFGEAFNRALGTLAPLENNPELSNGIARLIYYGQGFEKIAEEIRTHIEKLANQCDPK